MKTILIDVNLLPVEYKVEGGVKRYENEFNVKVVPFDASTKNVGGSIIIQPMIIE